MRRSPARLRCPFVCLLLSAACGRRESQVSAAPPPGLLAFEDVTARAGIAQSGDSWGLAWGDVDGDGWQDFWSSNHADDSSLYWNRGDGTFLSVALPRNRGDDHGVAWADFDRDGDEDLLELTGAQRGLGLEKSTFFVNTGKTLVERANQYGLAVPDLRGRMPVWLDWNRDGELDVLVTCAKRENEASQLLLQHEGRFSRAAEVPFGHEQAMFAQITSLGGLAAPHLVLHGFTYPQLVYDLGPTPPRDVTASFGMPELVVVEDVAVGDFDGDGRTDFFLARGFMGCEFVQVSPRELYAKLVVPDESRGLSFSCAGPITVSAHPMMEQWWHPPLFFIGADKHHPSQQPFQLEAAEAAGAWDAALTQGLEKGIFVLCDPSTNTWTIRLHGPLYEQATVVVESAEAPLENVQPLGFPAELGPPKPALFVPRDGKYVNVAKEAGIEVTNNLGVCAGDFDNDMDLDLYVLGGSSLRNRPNVLYENLGQGKFRAVAEAGGATGTSIGVADSVAVADYDRDGFLDLLVGNGREIGPMTQGPLQLFRNQGNANHWLRLRLRGRSGLEPIGAVVEVEAGGRTQYRTLGSHVHRGAQDERILHFGLGPNTSAARVTVRWPDGRQANLEGVAADQVLELRE